MGCVVLTFECAQEIVLYDLIQVKKAAKIY